MNKQTRCRCKVSCKSAACSKVKPKVVFVAIKYVAILLKAIDWVISIFSTHDYSSCFFLRFLLTKVIMINELLKVIRTIYGMNQAEAAGFLGISKSYLSEIESGKKRVTLDLLDKYHEVYGIAPSAVLFFDEKYKSKPVEHIRKKMAAFFFNTLAKMTADEK